jgi:hypothetical protein
MQTLTSRSTNRRRWPHWLGAGTTVLLTVTAATAAGAATATPNRPTGASGSVAALNGSSMEVQNPNSGQTTVSWTTTTRFSKTATEAVSALAVGDCVSVTGKSTNKSKTTIAARSITVTAPAANALCTGPGARAAGGSSNGPPAGFQFRTGNGSVGGSGQGANGSRPRFPEGGSGANNFRKQLASLSVAAGKVTAVTGSTVTISGFTLSPGSFPRRAASGNSTSHTNTKTKKPVPPKTQALKITTSSSTTVSATQSASPGDLAVGDCVSAFGPAATNGSVTATTVRITSTGGGSCAGVIGRFGGGGPGFFGGGPGAAGGGSGA